MKPDTEEKKQARKKFLIDCHSQDDIIIKAFSSESEWREYKKRPVKKRWEKDNAVCVA